MGLKESIAYALDHSISYNITSRELTISQLEARNAGARFLPSLDLVANHGWQKDSPLSSTNTWVSNLSVDLTESLYDNGVAITKRRIASLKEKSSELSFLRARDTLVRDVGIEFLRYSLATKLYEIQEDQYKLLKKQFDLVSASYRQGLKTRKDFLRFQTQLSRADIDLVNAKNAILRSKSELLRLLGVPSADSLEFAAAVETRARTSPLKRPNIESHFEVQIADIEKKVQEEQFSLTSRKIWPEISLSTGASYKTYDYLGKGISFTDRDKIQWNAMLGLTYSIWDWGIRRRDTEIASQQKAIQENTLDSKVLSTRQEIDQLMTDIEQLQKNYTLSEELLSLETKNLEILQMEYRQGKVQYLDYITSLKDFADAKIKFFTALYNLKQSNFSYLYHEGILYESLDKI